MFLKWRLPSRILFISKVLICLTIRLWSSSGTLLAFCELANLGRILAAKSPLSKAPGGPGLLNWVLVVLTLPSWLAGVHVSSAYASLCCHPGELLSYVKNTQSCPDQDTHCLPMQPTLWLPGHPFLPPWSP